ncbi:hypothetical protein TI05_16735 [Achromatium sp. WMS3]|nr:hypothetical protein TI05_16735 [Achromatium sp. WMS3]
MVQTQIRLLQLSLLYLYWFKYNFANLKLNGRTVGDYPILTRNINDFKQLDIKIENPWEEVP